MSVMLLSSVEFNDKLLGTIQSLIREIHTNFHAEQITLAADLISAGAGSGCSRNATLLTLSKTTSSRPAVSTEYFSSHMPRKQTQQGLRLETSMLPSLSSPIADSSSVSIDQDQTLVDVDTLNEQPTEKNACIQNHNHACCILSILV